MNPDALKLAGMEHRGGYYPPEYWREKTGVNPNQFPDYFITRGGNCQVTDKFRRDYQAHLNNVKSDWHAIGIPA
jgi:hypothetical protein